MSINKGYFGNDFCFEERFFPDHIVLKAEVDRLKDQKLVVVLTMGSFDLFHIGHARYLAKAKKLGDVLIVGVETDAKVRSRKKGDVRPVVPQGERFEMMAHTRYVDIITLKDELDEKWKLIKLLRPDVLQAVEGTYTEEQLEEIGKYCGEVVVQERQATTSTSAKIRLVFLAGTKKLAERLLADLPEFVSSFFETKISQINQQFSTDLTNHLETVVDDIRENGEL